MAGIECERQAKLAEEQRIPRATQRMIHAHRAKVLDGQLLAWQRSQPIADRRLPQANEGCRGTS